MEILTYVTFILFLVVYEPLTDNLAQANRKSTKKIFKNFDQGAGTKNYPQLINQRKRP